MPKGKYDHSITHAPKDDADYLRIPKRDRLLERLIKFHSKDQETEESAKTTEDRS
jgi:hypothetical protein